MIAIFVILGFIIYIFVITLILISIDEFPFNDIVDSKYGDLKLFGWPVYFPIWLIKEIVMFLYCDVFIRGLDKLFKKK